MSKRWLAKLLSLKYRDLVPGLLCTCHFHSPLTQVHGTYQSYCWLIYDLILLFSHSPVSVRDRILKEFTIIMAAELTSTKLNAENHLLLVMPTQDHQVQVQIILISFSLVGPTPPTSTSWTCAKEFQISSADCWTGKRVYSSLIEGNCQYLAVQWSNTGSNSRCFRCYDI